MAIIIVLFARAQKCMFLFEERLWRHFLACSPYRPQGISRWIFHDDFVWTRNEFVAGVFEEVGLGSFEWKVGGKHFKVSFSRRSLIGSQPACKRRMAGFSAVFCKKDSARSRTRDSCRKSFTMDFPRDDFFEQLLLLCDSLRASRSQ